MGYLNRGIHLAFRSMNLSLKVKCVKNIRPTILILYNDCIEIDGIEVLNVDEISKEERKEKEEG